MKTVAENPQSTSSKSTGTHRECSTSREARPERRLLAPNPALIVASASPIDGAPYTTSAPVQDVRVDHRRAHITMPEQLLNCPNVVTVFE
jgi:hypothetical protein